MGAIVARLGDHCSGCHAGARSLSQSVQAGDDGRSPAARSADEHLILELQRCAANLMVQSALDGAPSFGAVSDEHRRMAREVLAMNQGRREGWVQRWARRVLGR
jgi:hypothetical protein